MTESEVRAHVLHLSENQRRLILLCSRAEGWTFGQLSEKLSINLDSIKFAAQSLQEDGLAYVKYVHARFGRGFDGSRMFLTSAGEIVRRAVANG